MKPILSLNLVHEENRSVVLNEDQEVVFVSLSEEDAYDWWWASLNDSERNSYQEWMDELRIDAEMASAERYERAVLCCDR